MKEHSDDSPCWTAAASDVPALLIAEMVCSLQVEILMTMRDVFEEMEQMFDFDEDIEEQAATPPCEILQRGSELCIRVELPGVPRDNIFVTSADHMLVIEAMRPDPGDRNTIWSSEITHGIYRRVITLPPGVDTDSIDASYTDGILEIRLPVPPQLQARRIHISNSREA